MKNKKLSIIAFAVFVCLIVGLVAVALTNEAIKYAQINARDTARRETLQDVNDGILDYYAKNGTYPEIMRINTAIALLMSEEDGIEQVTVEITTPFTTPFKVGLEKGHSNGGITNPSSTQWCFIPDLADGYALGVLLEDGNWVNAGNSATKCQSL